MPPHTFPLRKLEKLVGHKLKVPAGACGREWALEEFKNVPGDPLLHPLQAQIAGYDPTQPAAKRFKVVFEYDGDTHEKGLRFIQEYLAGELPEDSEDELEAVPI
ncbi:hypothetical protein CYMTET_44915 [Cymbomonas tetramitiformis]|uniref:Uncharacterized protein n=1 Tax=Cymbomonas tetramitiformis TaxID=36881 RepID=A0AAE0BZA6_9CHLO|nr:hypothetical protein CYMTET_44915 [Cymbomonas tetramitiformis]